MNSGFPPLGLPQPVRADRRREKPRLAPLPAELLARRAEIARVLGVQVRQLSETLRQLSDEERRAVFYKLEHDARVTLGGTGLKPIAQPTSRVTLAIPRENNLEQFAAKLDAWELPLRRTAVFPMQALRISRAYSRAIQRIG
jgi:hypothetical protein